MMRELLSATDCAAAVKSPAKAIGKAIRATGLHKYHDHFLPFNANW
jgi:hypothetical protein